MKRFPRGTFSIPPFERGGLAMLSNEIFLHCLPVQLEKSDPNKTEVTSPSSEITVICSTVWQRSALVHMSSEFELLQRFFQLTGLKATAFSVNAGATPNSKRPSVPECQLPRIAGAHLSPYPLPTRYLNPQCPSLFTNRST